MLYSMVVFHQTELQHCVQGSQVVVCRAVPASLIRLRSFFLCTVGWALAAAILLTTARVLVFLLFRRDCMSLLFPFVPYRC